MAGNRWVTLTCDVCAKGNEVRKDVETGDLVCRACRDALEMPEWRWVAVSKYRAAHGAAEAEVEDWSELV